MIRLFRVFVPNSVLGLLVTEALLSTFCYVLATFLMLDSDPWIFLMYEDGLARIALVVASLLFGIYFNDLYAEMEVTQPVLLVQQFCLVVGMAFLFQAFLSYVGRNLVLPRWIMIVGSLTAVLLLPLWRWIYSIVVVRSSGQQPVLFLGTSDLSIEIAGHLEKRPELGLRTIGHLAEEGEEAPVELGPRLGRMDDLRQVVETDKPALIVAGLRERRGSLPIYDLLTLRLSGTRIEEVASVYETIFGRVSIQNLRPSQLVFTAALGPNPTSVSLQSIYSFAIAAIGAAITSPIMLLVAALVRMTSKGPALYRQRRVGLTGSEFYVYKFRSMYVDAEARTGAVWAQKNDPRVTPLGRWLRKLRLDELPQFFNVLRGEMAIVGPRPERPEFVKMLSEQIPFYPLRHFVKPGITGWAQINHKYGDTIEDTITKLEYDLYYLKNLSPWLDAYIIFHTAKVMLLRRGSQ
jgi:exopolysaccharide biosynthesis polyprenyl glycosylphosphotransferase